MLACLRGKGVANGEGASIEMLFQIFRLNFSWNMFKIDCFIKKFSKNVQCWGFSASSASTFNIGDLKLCDLAKFWVLNWLWRNRTSKKIGYDVILVTPSLLVTEKRHQNNVTFFSILPPPPNQNFWPRQCFVGQDRAQNRIGPRHQGSPKCWASLMHIAQYLKTI